MDTPNPVVETPVVDSTTPESQDTTVQDNLSAGSDDSFSDDIQDDLSDIDAAEASGQISSEEAKQLKKVLKIKVDGEEFEETVDFNDEEGLKRHIQKARAFDKRAKEHAKFKADVDNLMAMLQNDPEAVLEKLGLNVDDFAEKRLAKKIDELKKSPEQIEAEKMRKKLEEYEAREKQLKEQAEKAEFERLKDEEARAIQTEIMEAVETSAFLPKGDPEVYGQIGQLMAIAMSKGITNVTPKSVLPYVEKAYERRISSLVNKLDDAGLEKLMKARLDQYRKNKVQSKKPAPPAPKVVDTGKKGAKEEPKKPVKLSSFLRPR